MGLDQYAYSLPGRRLREQSAERDNTHDSGDEGEAPKFVWRKHSKLQTFMEALFEERTGLSAPDLNCGELRLQAGDIDALEQAVTGNALPHCEGGFFYGHQFQDEQAAEYRDYDLAFCAWARAELEQGSIVIYSCWW